MIVLLEFIWNILYCDYMELYYDYTSIVLHYVCIDDCKYSFGPLG